MTAEHASEPFGQHNEVKGSQPPTEHLPVTQVSNRSPRKAWRPQWTVVGQGISPQGNPQFQLVNRGDGTCLTKIDGEGFGTTDTAVCDAGDLQQVWDSRPIEYGASTGFGLVNMGSGGVLQAVDAEPVGEDQPEGQVNPGRLLVDHEFGPTEVGYDWQWQEVRQASQVAASVAFPAEDRTDFPFDLAVGDVDGVPAEHGIPREEAVVAYGAESAVALSVVNYNAGESGRHVTTLVTSESIGQAAAGGDYAPIAVDVADLDGDARAEIVVTYVGDDHRVRALVASYAIDDEGSASLDVVGGPHELGIAVPAEGAYSADAAVADFNGDGEVEIAWAGADAEQGGLATLWTVGVALTADGLTVTPGTKTTLAESVRQLDDGLGWNARVNVESGQFQDATDTTGARQVAVTWEDEWEVYLDVFAISTDGTAESIFPYSPLIPQAGESGGISVAVGGFATAGGGADLGEGIAVSPIDGIWNDNLVSLIQPLSAGEEPAQSHLTVLPHDDFARSGYELTAWDRLGDSLVLGEPVVFTVNQLVGLNLVGAQPPAHSDWLDGEFVNISRNQDFNLAMGGTETLTYENGTSQEVNENYGLSLDADITTTVETGVPLVMKTEASLGIGAELGASFESLGKATESASSSQTSSITQRTQDDDIVNAIIQDYQVYRYPVLSVSTWNRTDAAEEGCEGGCYGYWDVVVPGTPHPVNGSGKSFAFFQPSWQNGNALSYPQLASGEVPISDLGSYTYIEDAGATQTVTEPLVNEQYTISSVKTEQTLDLSGAASSGSTETSTKGWTDSVDLTSDNQSREWWLGNYGQHPDPALNLPYATILTFNERGYLGLVEWNSLSNRQEIRGFTARMPHSDDGATSGATYAAGPRVGEPVVFNVEVANYSLQALAEPVTVDFVAVPVDENFLLVSGDPVEIGTATITDMDPQSRVTVSSPEWTAQGGGEGSGQNWRIFVVIDRENSVEEIHEWVGTADDACPASSVQDGDELIDPMTGEPETLVCGQNNQGFGKLTVLPAADDAQAMQAAARAEAKFVGAGILTRDPSTLRLDSASEVPQVTTGKATTVLLRAGADRDLDRHRTVIVYDGPPETGQVVAVTRMQGVLETGLSTASSQYVPTEAGLHDLHAVMLGDDTERGMIVRVNAVAADGGGGDGGGGSGGSGGSGPDGGSGDAAGSAGDGDLASTGQDAWPWMIAGLVALLLVTLGAALLHRARLRRGAS